MPRRVFVTDAGRPRASYVTSRRRYCLAPARNGSTARGCAEMSRPGTGTATRWQCSLSASGQARSSGSRFVASMRGSAALPLCPFRVAAMCSSRGTGKQLRDGVVVPHFVRQIGSWDPDPGCRPTRLASTHTRLHAHCERVRSRDAAGPSSELFSGAYAHEPNPSRSERISSLLRTRRPIQWLTPRPRV